MQLLGGVSEVLYVLLAMEGASLSSTNRLTQVCLAVLVGSGEAWVSIAETANNTASGPFSSGAFGGWW